jgi:alpha-tubulin suppressor-like RCC1 family protein
MLTMRSMYRLLAGAATVMMVAACGGGDGATSPTPGPNPNPNPNPNPQTATVASVSVTPSSPVLYTGRTVSLVAVARDSAGNALTNRIVTWSSSAIDVATVSATGVVSGIAVGQATVTATVDGKSATANVSVQTTPVAAVVITPDSVNVTLGSTVTLTAQAKDDQGATLNGRVIRWSSSAPAIVRIDSVTGVATAVTGGSAIITASSEGRSRTARVIVRVPVASVSVVSALDTIEAYDNLPMQALVRDANQQLLTDRTVRWTSSNTAVAVVDSVTGVLTGLDRGTVTVTAQSEGKSGSATRVVVIKYRSLVAGTQHSCDIASGGIVWCWGQNGDEGRIGMASLGATVFSPTPVRVANTGPDGIRAVKLASFGRHTCALDANGKAWCWGGNGWGALGVSTIAQSATPVAVAGGLRFKDIAVGSEHSCALTTVGAMYCWGHNDWRQFALNTPGMSESPVPVAPQLTFASLTAGATFTCGVTTAREAYCWGYSGWGNLGDAKSISYGNTFSVTPSQVVGTQAWAQVGAGQIHTCGLTVGGQAFCWGNNGGKLGNGGTAESSAPSPLSGAPSLSALAVGANHNCAISTAQEVWCWGLNGNGQVGQTASTAVIRPTRVPGLTAAEVAASGIGTGSGSHSCAVSADRLTVKCWGRNDTGQLGAGSSSAGTVANVTPLIVIGQKPL